MDTRYFSYSKEEGESIIVPDTLFNESPMRSHDAKKLFMDLKKASEKDLKLQLHMTTLSDYWRERMIPRGLRIKKFPSFGADDKEFRNKWEAILNKCSLDLMLLLIEEAKKQQIQTQKDITALKEEISVQFQDQQIPFEEEINDGLAKLKRELKQAKLAKFQRDQSDYKEDKVYKWKTTADQSYYKAKTQRKRTVSFQLPSSEDENSGVEDQPSNLFLESKPKREDRTRRRQNTKPEEAEGNPRNTSHRRWQTRSQSRMNK